MLNWVIFGEFIGIDAQQEAEQGGMIDTGKLLGRTDLVKLVGASYVFCVQRELQAVTAVTGNSEGHGSFNGGDRLS